MCVAGYLAAVHEGIAGGVGRCNEERWSPQLALVPRSMWQIHSPNLGDGLVRLACIALSSQPQPAEAQA